jgi:hypothetical protein
VELQYHQHTDIVCPDCGTKLLADDLGGVRLKCPNPLCGWKGIRMTEPLLVEKTTNGYIVEVIVRERRKAVFTTFAELIDWLYRHFSEDQEKNPHE